MAVKKEVFVVFSPLSVLPPRLRAQVFCKSGTRGTQYPRNVEMRCNDPQHQPQNSLLRISVLKQDPKLLLRSLWSDQKLLLLLLLLLFEGDWNH